MGSNDNMKISGAGSMAGGVYKDVGISGSGRITSALECDTLRVSGSVVCDGPVKAGRIKVSGSAQFSDDVQAENVNVSGGASFNANLKAGALNVSGGTDVRGSVSGGHVIVRGTVTMGGDCEVERFDADGAFTVGGLLSADTISVRMYGPCKAREVGGESVEIRPIRKPWRDFAATLGIGGPTGLEADSVEGDHVLLQRAKVRTVRGRDVELGAGCEVDLVEYTAEFKQAPGAKVKTSRKAETVS